VLDKAMLRRADYFLSAVAINDGGGNFTLVALPREVQYSCVKAIHCTDLDGDGRNDLVLGGNDAGFVPQFSRLDASFGHVLLNRGGGRFDRVENRESGFFVRGDVKQIFELQTGGGRRLTALVNNQPPAFFRIHR
jgi:hypothetical protein